MPKPSTAPAPAAAHRSAAPAAPALSPARQGLLAKAKALAKDGVGPRAVSVEELIAPLPALRGKIAEREMAFQLRHAGLGLADAADEVAAELVRESQGMPEDARTLRARPQATKALLAEAIATLSSLHGFIHRQVRGRTMREMAKRFGTRSGNTFPELLADAKTFLAAAGDPALVQAFDLVPVDLDDLRDLVGRLSLVSTEDVSREDATEAQLSKIDLLRLQLEAYFMKLGSASCRVYVGDPDGLTSFLGLLPRQTRTGKHTGGGSGEGTGEGTGSGGPGTGEGASDGAGGQGGPKPPAHKGKR